MVTATLTIKRDINLDIIGEENRKQNEFITFYILKHFGSQPADPVAAYSNALDAYWESLGYEFGGDKETFILPDIN